MLADNANSQVEPTWDVVVAAMTPEDREKRAKLRVQLHEIEATEPDPLPTAYAYVNNKEAAPQAYVLRMGDPKNRLDPVEPSVPRVLKASYEIPHEQRGTPHGARQLAGIAGQSADRARDGEPHLAIPHGHRDRAHAQRFRSDGRQAVEPSAARLAGRRSSSAKGWSVKTLDRLIVTSSVYRQSAAAGQDARRRSIPTIACTGA